MNTNNNNNNNNNNTLMMNNAINSFTTTTINPIITLNNYNNNNNNNNNNIAFGGDENFIQNLTNFLTPNDVTQICESYIKPIANNNINPRTGRVRIGIPKTRPRKILRPDTLRNYKSVILRFCRFKRDKFGKDSPITREIAIRYGEEKIADGKNKKDTMNTVVNILNKYIFFPVLGEELPKPTASKILTGNYFSNKPKFMHAEIALAVLKMYKSCKNRDHVHKILLIYYTGLRSSEASSLTFNDIIDGYSKRNVVIPVRLGKGRKIRNVVIFRGGPMAYYREYFIPYIVSKMESLMLSLKGDEKIEDLLNHRIFSNSKYHACIKSFKKRLDWAVMKIKDSGIVASCSNSNGEGDNNNAEEEEDDEEEDEEEEEEEGNAEFLKGSGLHSLRADWATRTIKLLFLTLGNPAIAENMTAILLGHRINSKIINKHYINLGDGFEESGLNKIKELLAAETSLLDKNDNFGNYNNLKFQKDKISLLFKSRGRIIKNLFNPNRKRNRRNFTFLRLFNIVDNNYIFLRKIDKVEENTATIFNELNNDENNNNNDEEGGGGELLPPLTSNGGIHNFNDDIEEEEDDDDGNNSNNNNDNRDVDLVGNLVFV